MLLDTKICTKCHTEKPSTLEYFHAQRSKADGLTPRCKECRNATSLKSGRISKNYTYEGFLQGVWSNMCTRCREEKTYKGKLNISRDQFMEWGIKTLPEFCESLGITLENGLIGKGISIDKIEDSIGYRVGNLQWLTHAENNSKGTIGRFDKAVNQYSLQGELIAKFPSIKEANIALNKKPNDSGIGAVLSGRQKTSHGFKWILSE